MTYRLTIHEKSTYLHAVVTGPNTRENVVSYLDEIMNECTTRECFRVLIEERLEGPRLGTLDVFQIVTRESSRAIGKMRAIAYVDVNAEGDLMRFAETVAVNRAMPARVFATVMNAERWLIDEDRRDAESAAQADDDERDD